MEIESAGVAKVMYADKGNAEITHADKREEMEEMGSNANRKFAMEMDLDLSTPEWVGSGRPKNKLFVGCMDPRPKIVAEETSRTVEEKPPRAEKWKKMTRGDKRGARVIKSVAGTKRDAENEVMDGDQASNKQQKHTRYDVSSDFLEDFQLAVTGLQSRRKQ
ncbi:hypothetical protein U1Q18_015146 [Sarracenia purpurea var. burkii]